MFECESVKTKKRGKRARSFECALRSCSFCGSSNGIEIADYNRRNDIVDCQICGAQYLLQSMNPVRLEAVDQEDLYEDMWELDMDD